MTRRSRLPLLLTLVLAAAVPQAASAAPTLELQPLLDTSLRASGTHARPCHEGLRPGARGVATRELLSAAPGLLHLSASGRRGDWDVALFDATGAVLAAGASADAQEFASGWTATGGPLTLQACRRTRRAGTRLPVLVEHAPLPADMEALRAQAPQLVKVHTPTRADKDRLGALGLDMSEHGGTTSLGVVLHSETDREALRRAGLTWTVLEDDLVARAAADRAAERRYAARTARSALPSGRDSYRELFDYNAEMKALAEQNPGLVKLITLPERTYEGREVLGLEITTNVDRADGKPAFANLGVHHAREWPAGEMVMEWAHELVNGYRAGDPRTKRIVENARHLIVPIVNPDGFETSRTTSGAPDAGEDETIPDTAYIALRPYEYRRKNCRLPEADTGNCLLPSFGAAEAGVDPNRNYGALWGGPGADTNPLTQTYRGPGPFSEPESRNVRALVSRNQVTTLITNHTTAGLVLRAPGLAELGDPVDEHRGYKQLGDDMAAHNGYFSQKSFELYDTTGTTEDWSYNATGGYGFTFEIYCGSPNYETGDCDAPAFHPRYPRVVEEWLGTSAQADHTADPGALEGFDGKGNREAYYIAAESTIDESRHSVLEGRAPAGATLRLHKAFKTLTFPQPADDGGEPQPLEIDDELESTYEVGRDGAFRWHVNPSTRPIVAKQSGRPAEGPPSPAREDLDGAAGPDARPCPNYYPQVPIGPTPEQSDPTCWNDHPFEIAVGGGVDNDTTTVRFTFPTTDDWDLEVFEDTNGDGASDPGDELVDSSGNGATNQQLGYEEVTLPKPAATTRYVARMINYAASGAYDGTVTYNPPPPVQEVERETWTLTCEVGGRVLQTEQVQVDRGQVRSVDLTACRRRAGERVVVTPSACASSLDLRSVRVRPGGRGATLSARRRGEGPVTIDVFQVSEGRRLVERRRVARLRAETAEVRWNGRGATDGYYVVRFRSASGDVRRVALRRTKGRFAVLPAFHRRDRCGLLRAFRLRGPVFGRRLGIAYELGARARVSVTVRRGGEVVKRFETRSRRAGRTHRLRLPAAGRARGNHRVRIVARRGEKTVRATLVSRRL